MKGYAKEGGGTAMIQDEIDYGHAHTNNVALSLSIDNETTSTLQIWTVHHIKPWND